MQWRIKDWKKFQHFKDRSPPWIKLYRDVLNDVEWFELDPAAAKVLVMLWLIASENDGLLPEMRKLSFRLRMDETSLKAAFSLLSHWLERDDITAISEQHRGDAPEREGETEKEREEETEEKPARTPRKPSTNLESADLVAEGVLLQHAKDWRTARKCPVTQTAWDELKTEAAKAGITPGEAVRICAKASWRGFNSTWKWQQYATGSASTADANAEAARILGFSPSEVIDA